MKATVAKRLSTVPLHSLLEVEGLGFLLHSWDQWTDHAVVKDHVRPLFEADELLPQVLEKFVHTTRSWGSGDSVVKRTLHGNPKSLEFLTDIAALEPIVARMLTRGNLSAAQRTAGESFMKNMERIRQGKASDE